jgi:methyl-accepting chemotaxis protein
MFVEASECDSTAYREFWVKLNRGEYQAADNKRVGKGGKEVWIEASYNPIRDTSGKPFKVVKLQPTSRKRKSEALRMPAKSMRSSALRLSSTSTWTARSFQRTRIS